MSVWPVRTEQDLRQVQKIIENRKRPFTVQLTAGAPRTIEQNRLQRKWLQEAQDQGDMTAEEYRGYCKLHYGVPMLRNENEPFRLAYDKIIMPHSYEEKLEMMMLPLDFPVTRLMTTKQKTRYLDAMYQFFRELGFTLTEPRVAL